MNNPSVRKLEVFYLDDEIDLLDVFREAFNSIEYNITTFAKADEFLRACATNEPDLIFLDYRLPGTTGDKVAAELDKILKHKIPKFLITGDLSVVLAANFEKTIPKPFSPALIYEILEKRFQAVFG